MMQIGVRWGPDGVRCGPMGSDWVISHTPVTHAQTWASDSALYQFGRLSLQVTELTVVVYDAS